jgi:hypothetical protein
MLDRLIAEGSGPPREAFKPKDSRLRLDPLVPYLGRTMQLCRSKEAKSSQLHALVAPEAIRLWTFGPSLY